MLNCRDDTLTLLKTRRSAVAATMAGPGPTEAELEEILAAATRVPDHGKLAPWRIQVLRRPGQEALGAVFAELFAIDHPDANDKQIAFERNRLSRAPLVLAVTAKIQIPHKIPEMEQLLSGGAVCTNILIAAHALGYVAQWLTEWPAYRREVLEALGHAGEHDRILGFIYIGMPTEPAEERPRPDRSAVVSEWSGPARVLAADPA